MKTCEENQNVLIIAMRDGLCVQNVWGGSLSQNTLWCFSIYSLRSKRLRSPSGLRAAYQLFPPIPRRVGRSSLIIWVSNTLALGWVNGAIVLLINKPQEKKTSLLSVTILENSMT